MFFSVLLCLPKVYRLGKSKSLRVSPAKWRDLFPPRLPLAGAGSLSLSLSLSLPSCIFAYQASVVRGEAQGPAGRMREKIATTWVVRGMGTSKTLERSHPPAHSRRLVWALPGPIPSGLKNGDGGRRCAGRMTAMPQTACKSFPGRKTCRLHSSPFLLSGILTHSHLMRDISSPLRTLPVPSHHQDEP